MWPLTEVKFSMLLGLVALSLVPAQAQTAPAVSLSPTNVNFGGPQPLNTTAARSVRLTNTGNGPLNISSISASGDFAQTNTCGTSVAAGAQCTVSVTFTP